MNTPRPGLACLWLTAEEIDTLAVALARTAEPDTEAYDADSAATVLWHHRHPNANLGTALAEARP